MDKDTLSAFLLLGIAAIIGAGIGIMIYQTFKNFECFIK